MQNQTSTIDAGHRTVPARLVETADGIEVRCSCHGSRGHLLFRLVHPGQIELKCRDTFVLMEVSKAQHALARRPE